MADITVDQIATQTFFPTPQLFFATVEKKYDQNGQIRQKIKRTSRYARELSSDSKLAYGPLFNRCQLSIQNYQEGDDSFVDKHGAIFLNYTVEDMMDLLGKSKPTVLKIKKELTAVGLLREVKQGANRPNRLYLQNVEASYQEYEYYDAELITSGRDKGKIIYHHVKTMNQAGKVIFQSEEVERKSLTNCSEIEIVGGQKFLPPTNGSTPTKNGGQKPLPPTNGSISTKNGGQKSLPPVVKSFDPNKNILDILDNSSRRAEENLPAKVKEKRYIHPEYYSLLQVIADKYNDRYSYPQGYRLTHEQKMKIGQYLSSGYATSDEVLQMIDRIPHDCERPLAYLLQMLQNLKLARQAEKSMY